MTMYLRRALLNRNATFIRSSVVHPRIILEPLSLYGSKSHEGVAIPDINFIRESRRGFAKGRRSRDDSGSTSVDVALDIGPAVKENTAAQMDAAIVSLSRELSKIRTGRASAGMLDHIIVETGGVKMPLNRMALVSVLDSKTLSINPYDPNTLKALQKAIVNSPLGLNPKEDGERLVSSIPPLTKEHVQAMCKVVSKSSEDVKQSIRRARQKALDTIKKAGSSLPKDSVKRLEKEIDELTKKFVKSAEDMCKSKEKEITQS
uniref:Ribosome-recycling factor, chloroplastic n=1 Tax=Monsonia emarginata TaxID=28966 RepID=A0A0G4AMA5_9ROSI|nr:ribosome recycling factor [Monsonia emarginata]